MENQTAEKRVYTVPELQEILGVSGTTIHRLIRKGCFKGVRIGSVTRISKHSFDKWLRNQI